ncbi:MAG TPA: phosphomannomutase/phosphoglucomutase [Mycobacteriales bacterium]|nr:phosphomannomutase/phosphoglucomutase [Mycobacteriales bacterium]
MTKDLSAIFKAYDVRGVYPDQLDDDIARAAGAAFVRVLDAGQRQKLTVVTAYDMRPHSRTLAEAFAAGATSQGADVIEAGLGPTDLIYYASGSLDLPGAVFTASHNPGRYGGIKLCRAGAAPVGQDTGLKDIEALVAQGVPAYDGPQGTISQRAMVGEYADYLRTLVPLDGGRALKVVVDAGNGMGGMSVPEVLGPIASISVDPLYFELDGTFPNHEANPIEPENLVDLQKRVRETGADIGLAFDGDADRCFVVDEKGDIVSPSTLTGLVAVRELARDPGSTIIHNLITSKSVPELVREHGGTPVRTRVGHSFIKAEMARTGAVFGGEHSGHFYFRDFWRADSGMLAALHVLAALGESEEPLSAVLAPYLRYHASGEINSTVDDAAARTAAVEAAFTGRAGVSTDHLDGLTVDAWDAEGWWFNLRPSNTEPLLRFNGEGREVADMVRVRDEVLALVRG